MTSTYGAGTFGSGQFGGSGVTNYTSTGRSKHQTLTANTVDVVTLDQGYPRVEVIAETIGLYFTIDTGQAGNQTSLTPTIAGDGCFYVGPGMARTVTDDTWAAGTTPASVIRLISTSAVAYHVTGLDR